MRDLNIAVASSLERSNLWQLDRGHSRSATCPKQILDVQRKEPDACILHALAQVTKTLRQVQQDAPMQADSVRRKRKSKMNKHKHRKRLKKLRHRSK